MDSHSLEETLKKIASSLNVRTEAVSLVYYQGDDEDPVGWSVQVPAKAVKVSRGRRIEVRILRLALKVYGATLEEALEAAVKEAASIGPGARS
ncbi:MAG: hypothetical protein WC565_05255 [Parcubacteria group bacterium]|jgi:hypothetical protein